MSMFGSNIIHTKSEELLEAPPNAIMVILPSNVRIHLSHETIDAKWRSFSYENFISNGFGETLSFLELFGRKRRTEKGQLTHLRSLDRKSRIHFVGPVTS